MSGGAQPNAALNAIPFVDDLIKEYLLFRGFTQTLRTFDAEKKNDKLKTYQVEKIIEQMFFFINNYDITSLLDLWSYLDSNFFSKMDQDFAPTTKKLEVSLRRYYLVYAANSGRFDKVREFFELFSVDLAKDPEWRNWFALPYMKNPAADATFEVFFSKVWVETFSLSLHNFLTTIVKSVPLPKLLTFDLERQLRKKLEYKIDDLRKENESLKEQISVFESLLMKKAKEEYATTPVVASTLSSSSVSGSVGPTTPSSVVRGVSATVGEKEKEKDDEKTENSFEIFKERMKAILSDGKGEDDKVVIGTRGSLYARGPFKIGDALPELPVGNMLPESIGAFSVASQETLWTHTSSITKCRFSPLGSKVACGSADGVVRIWSTEATSRNTTIFCFSEVLSIEWEAKTNKLLLCGTADAKIKVWNVFGDKAFGDIAIDPEFPRVADLACNPNGTNFVAAVASANGARGMLLAYNLKTLRIENKLSTDATTCINTISFNHNGSMLVTGCADGLIRIYDMKTCAAITGWQAHRGEVIGVQFSADETSVYSVGSDDKIYQWDIHNVGKVSREYVYDGAGLFPSVASSNSRPTSPITSSNPASFVNSFLSSNNPTNNTPPSNVPTIRNCRIAFDSEGTYFVVGSKHNYALLYKIDQPQPIQYIPTGHAGSVVAVDWHPTKNSILTGSRDQSVKISHMAPVTLQ